MKKNILLILIIIFGFLLRTYDLNWDQGFHLHPDERAIIMYALPLNFPTSFSNFMSIQSPWNPHFFAYGSFPLYFLKILSLFFGNIDIGFANYAKINLLGRFISAIFDTITIFIIFLLGKKIFNKTIGLIASFFYAISVFAIQASHFYAVDAMLTFFMITTLFFALKLYEKEKTIYAILTGIFLGLSLATKISALSIAATIGLSLVIDFILIFLKHPHKPKVWLPHLPRVVKKLIVYEIIICFSAIVIFAICEPYAFIDFNSFLQQNQQQYEMTKNAFVFPYTLQYVGITPYFYELKNVFLWGQGPLLAIFTFIGTIYVSFLAINKEKNAKWAKELLLVVFFWSYFIVIGKFAVGWMRYMLPIYPMFSIFGAVIFYKLSIYIKNHFIRNTYYIVLTTFLMIWPLSFMHIYATPNTRLLATNWINTNIPIGKTLATEHWDDGLPLFGGENYKNQTLELYNPDTTEKWQKINMQLSQSDYIVIASNRLYVPLQKLTDCSRLDPYHCYPITAKYYKDLFSGKLGFKKVAEFSTSPVILFLNIPINDQGADESFTVYDHPKVIIFKKITD